MPFVPWSYDLMFPMFVPVHMAILFQSPSIHTWSPIIMAPKKHIHLNFFDLACTSTHLGIGQWRCEHLTEFFKPAKDPWGRNFMTNSMYQTSRHPNDNSRTKDSLDYYIWLAKLAERGKISTVFFADHYGSMIPTFKHERFRASQLSN